jgi:hypothetical protein
VWHLTGFYTIIDNASYQCMHRRFEREFNPYNCYSGRLGTRIQLQILSPFESNLIAANFAFVWQTRFAASDVGIGSGWPLSGVRQDFAQAADKSMIAQCQSDNRGTAYAAGS